MNKHLRNAFGILLVVSLLAPLAASAAASPGVVNVNTATAEQLQLLPRIGASVAQRILDYRKENGKFASVEDLMLVRGIGESTFAGLKPYVSTGGETTLSAKVKSPRGGKAGQAGPSKPAPQAAEPKSER
jgi:competence protein ComEA